MTDSPPDAAAPPDPDPDPARDDAVVDPHDGDDEYLVAIVFDKPSRASEVLVNLTNLQVEGKLRLGDAVIVAKDQGGKARVLQTVDITPGRGALVGTWWGLLAGLFVGPLAIAGGAAAGALYGKLVDRGLDDGWIGEMKAWLEPGRSALLLLVTLDDQPAVLRELRRYEGHVVTTDFPDAVRAELEEALRDHLGDGG
ncbi:MAG TPA: DUF1269 domain-containing protein [Acidimicrobiales bacterium]|nr:DUF1269 domain-containing protein [Acidimicrobiales bacterium]